MLIYNLSEYAVDQQFKSAWLNYLILRIMKMNIKFLRNKIISILFIFLFGIVSFVTLSTIVTRLSDNDQTIFRYANY